MKKLIVLMGLFVSILMVLSIIPRSPLTGPVLKPLIKIAENKWNSTATYSDTAMDLLKGEFMFDNLEIGSAKDKAPTWSISFGRPEIDIDYPSWLGDQPKIDRLLIKDMVLRRHGKKTSGNDNGNAKPGPTAGKGKQTPENSPRKAIPIKRGILIRHLSIQGSLLLETVAGSGKTDRVRIESFVINKKNILFDGRPDTFVASIIRSG